MEPKKKKIPELKRVKDQIVFDGNYMEVYLPKSYFKDLKVAYFSGKRITTLGVFMFRIFKDADNRQSYREHVFKCPAQIETLPGDIEEQSLRVRDDDDEEALYVLKYFNGDVFMDSVYILAHSSNVNMFTNLLINGKLPISHIDYTDLLKLYIDCLSINKINLNAPSVIYEIIISELCRDRSDVYRSFRHRASHGKTEDMSSKSYVMVNIRNLSRFNSTFSALSFEDMTYSLVTSINKKRYDLPERYTPIEQTLKF